MQNELQLLLGQQEQGIRGGSKRRRAADGSGRMSGVVGGVPDVEKSLLLMLIAPSPRH